MDGLVVAVVLEAAARTRDNTQGGGRGALSKRVCGRDNRAPAIAFRIARRAQHCSAGAGSQPAMNSSTMAGGWRRPGRSRLLVLGLSVCVRACVCVR